MAALGDLTTSRVGSRTYEIIGLHGRADDLRGRALTAATLTADLVDAATRALEEWRGRHAATFVERGRVVSARLGELKWRLHATARMLEDFPSAPVAFPYDGIELQLDSFIPSADDSGTSSAVPADLRHAAMALRADTGPLRALGDAFHLRGVTATVSYQRSLTGSERTAYVDQGLPPNLIDTITATQTEPVDVATLVPMPDDGGLAGEVVALRNELADFTEAVAQAFEDSDHVTLALLAEHPELAGYLLPGAAGSMNGEAALAVLLAQFDLIDTAQDGGDADGVVSEGDLEAVVADLSMPAHVRAAAEHLLSNRDLFGNLDTISVPDQPITAGDGKFSRDDLRLFIEMREALEVVALDFQAFDLAAKPGGEADGFVSFEDIEAVAGNRNAPAELRAAAQWLLDHPVQLGKLGAYAREANDRQVYGTSTMALGATQGFTSFTFEDLIARVVDDQGFASDPARAAEFVRTLPAVGVGDTGLSIFLMGDDGVRALANAALTHTAGDLVGQHGVIAHLPETTGAVRNQLITAFYDRMAQQMDGLLAGPLSGDPHAPGHPGANWMLAAPWASDGVRSAITGEFSVFGVGPTSGASQAAADGNQWIFNDIGGRYAAFLELYGGVGPPSTGQLQGFFDDHFGDGDAHLRTGFAAYVATVEETDPVQRQRLLFQGNTLIALHEQAGVQPWLERVSIGPDNIVVRYIDLQFGNRVIHVDRELTSVDPTNNHIVDMDLLDLDVGGLDPSDFAVPGGTTYVGAHSHPVPDAVVLPEIGGVEVFAGDYPQTTTQWWEDGGGGGDPDSSDGTGASSWPDPAERMWTIHKLFEQTHTDPAMWETDRIEAGFDDGRFGWLDEGTGL